MTHRDPPHALRDLALRALLFLVASCWAIQLVACGGPHS